MKNTLEGVNAVVHGDTDRAVEKLTSAVVRAGESQGRALGQCRYSFDCYMRGGRGGGNILTSGLLIIKC